MTVPAGNRSHRERGLIDGFGRVIDNVRISITDRCNFRCSYCMPEEGMLWMTKSELLTYEEITRLATVFADLGVTKIRLTGGEPLMRKDLHVLVRELSGVAGIGDLSLTTNGYFLAAQVEDLAQAGLRRINVSLDSLNPETFSSIVRREYFEKVWSGLRLLESHHISPVKINVVLIRGINDHEIPEFVRMSRSGSYIVRFIEFMPIGAGDGWTIGKVVTTDEVIRRITELGVPLRPVERHGVQPADRFVFEDGRGEVGFISSVSEPFCFSCNRVRVTSDGKLRTCLFSHRETDLRSLLRQRAGDAEIREIISEAILNKEEGHLINQAGFVRPERTMSQIGG